MNNSASKIKLTSIDDLLGVTEPHRAVENGIVRLPLEKMHEFKAHPFRVIDDEKMAETVASIRQHGVLVPGIVREDKDNPGTYEIIAGHRRHHASGLAGLPDMPVIIKNMTDDEATVVMVDSNIQREDLLPSERAKAYRMKYDALKRIGTSDGIRSDEKLAQQAGESRNTIQRYIRLTYLDPELLQLVDDKKLPVTTAVEISYLLEKEQQILLGIMKDQKVIPSGDQAVKLKEYSKAGKLTDTVIQILLEKEEMYSKVSLKEKDIRKYFPKTYTGEEITEVIYKLLDEWSKSHMVERGE
ncbi:MAG: ParB/RepB/Spo0J family partition protein [Lachnospiraceae bacterium]